MCSVVIFLPYPVADRIQNGMLQVKTSSKENLNPKENQTHNTAHSSESV